LDSATQAILEKARAKERATANFQRAYDEDQARRSRAYAAWQAVQTYKGDAIPDSVTGPALHRCYAERIVALGQVLKSDGWQGRLDAVEPGSDAKTYALTMLRRAMDGDIDTVTTMVRESISTMFNLGLEADRWLREGLMYEVLDIQPAPEPPLGWEGQYLESVDTADDFIRWIDREFLIHEITKRGQGAAPSSGQLVRNAFLLVQKLDLAGMPLEPLGPFTLQTELAVLRNLRRLCSSRRSNPAAVGPSTDPIRELQDAAAALASARQADEKRRAPERLVRSLRDAIRDKPNVPLDELAKMIGQFLQAVRAVGWGDRFERLKADVERQKAELADSLERKIAVKQWEAALAIYRQCDEGNFQGAVDLMAKSEQAGKAATWDEQKVYGGVVSLVRNTIPDALVSEPNSTESPATTPADLLTTEGPKENEADHDRMRAEQNEAVVEATYEISEQSEAGESADAELQERENHILRALLMLKAESKRRSVSRIRAARKADPACKASSYNKAVASLVGKGLVKSKRGPNGGIWLTPDGVSAATALGSACPDVLQRPVATHLLPGGAGPGMADLPLTPTQHALALEYLKGGSTRGQAAGQAGAGTQGG
jgi:hypothetical protein